MTQLSSEQKDSLKVVFKAMDRDGSGVISATEMLECLRTIQASTTLQEVEAMLRELGLEQGIGWDDFILVMEEKLAETSSESEVFEILDQNGTGKINPVELKASLLRFGLDASDQVVDEMIRAADLDGDGIISRSEFMAAGLLGDGVRVRR